jgi:hypothetical protein
MWIIQHRWLRLAGQVPGTIQVPVLDLGHASTHEYLQVSTAQIYLTCGFKWLWKALHYYMTTSDISEGRDDTLLSFGHLPLSLKTSIISSHGIALDRSHHAPSTDAAWVLSSESECRIFKTVSPPWEKVCSTSVDVAAYQVMRWIIEYVDWYIPGMDRKSFAIKASGCPLAAMVVQYCKPFEAFEITGVLSHSSTVSPVTDTLLKAEKLSKYLLWDDDAYRDKRWVPHRQTQSKWGSYCIGNRLCKYNLWLVVQVPLSLQKVFSSCNPLTRPFSLMKIRGFVSRV